MSGLSRDFIRRTGIASSVFAAAVIATGTVFGTLGEARAETLCGNHADVISTLGTRYAEAPVGMGLSRNGGVVELFAAADGETWTLVLTMPDGRSTIVATGEGWTAAPVRIAGQDS